MSDPRLPRSEGRRLRAWEGQSTAGIGPWQTCWGLRGSRAGKLEPPSASREHTAFPPDRAAGPACGAATGGNHPKSPDSSDSSGRRRFSSSSSQQALTPENRSPTVRPALRLTTGRQRDPSAAVNGNRRGKRMPHAVPQAPPGPTRHAPSNRSRKRFRFPAPLGSGPFRGPFFCAVDGAASAAAGPGPIVGS